MSKMTSKQNSTQSALDTHPSSSCDACNTQSHLHSESDNTPDHRAELRRIKRISGQLSGIERMIIEGRYCPDILMQTRAVSAAMRSLEASLLERHIKHCVQAAFNSDDELNRESKITELIEIFAKRLDR